MISEKSIDVKTIQEILVNVLKPGRYIGGELNTVRVKRINSSTIRFALAFPDIYDVGMSHLGSRIIYGILNSLEDVIAERVYAPWVDMEYWLRSSGIELFSLESFTPIKEFDIVGFSLQYELCYTNVLNMLELSKIPLLSSERTDDHPLIIAGGPCTVNPEPVADFFDLFVIGEGEDVVVEIIDCYRRNRNKSRLDILSEMSNIEGVYVPEIHKDKVIRRRIVADLDNTFYPTKYIVPFVRIIHDRAVLEVMRGCSRGCRFCQAGMTYRPVRERSLKQIRALAKDIIDNTGYEELSLSSLSSCDHTSINNVVGELIKMFEGRRVAISLPSLRMDSFSLELAKMIESVKKTGLTFAPEVATDRLQRVINKGIAIPQIMSTTSDAFSSGWNSIKLYFMIGLPTETDDDVIEIAKLSTEILHNALRINKRSELNVSVSTFVPKPHTPFQWERQVSIDEIRHKHQLLLKRANKKIHFSLNSPYVSLLECVFARGDRRLSRVLLEAHSLGCKLDGWSEMFDFNKWMEAFKRCNVDLSRYTSPIDVDQDLPWDYIDTLLSKQFLISEREKAYRAALTPNCRDDQCSLCGVCNTKSGISMKLDNSVGEIIKLGGKKQIIQPKSRLRFHFAKKEELKFISHLDVVNVFTRCFRRIGIPIAYSHGFNPHPKISFSSALPLGITSDAEYADIDLLERVEPDDFVHRCNEALPNGLEVIKAKEIPLNSSPLMALNAVADYLVCVTATEQIDYQNKIHEIMEMKSIPIRRRKKPLDINTGFSVDLDHKGDEEVKLIDIRPLLRRLELLDSSDGSIRIHMSIFESSNSSRVRPEEIIELVFIGPSDRSKEEDSLHKDHRFSVLSVHKVSHLIEHQGQIFPPMDAFWA